MEHVRTLRVLLAPLTAPDGSTIRDIPNEDDIAYRTSTLLAYYPDREDEILDAQEWALRVLKN